MSISRIIAVYVVAVGALTGLHFIDTVIYPVRRGAARSGTPP